MCEDTNGESGTNSEPEQEPEQLKDRKGQALSTVQINLVYSQLTPDQQAFVDLEAQGNLKRGEIARRIGVTTRALLKWFHKDGVKTLIESRTKGSDTTNLEQIERTIAKAEETGETGALGAALRDIEEIRAVSLARGKESTALKAVELRMRAQGLLTDAAAPAQKPINIHLNLSGIKEEITTIEAVDITPSEET